MVSRVQTGLRMPEDKYEEITDLAAAIGVSINSMLLMMIDIGLRAYKAEILPESVFTPRK